MKIAPLRNSQEKRIGWMFFCPACKTGHSIQTQSERQDGPGPTWEFDGNQESPTISPSIRVMYDFDGDKPNKQCHSFVRAGKIEYCGDCTHSLAGQTVELPDL